MVSAKHGKEGVVRLLMRMRADPFLTCDNVFDQFFFDS